jgi:FlaG/FlaF family flagellin (archaellin)
MIRLVRNKRGASPVVSAVIMMLVVMIGMSALFAFFVGYSKDFQAGSGSAVLESMTVEDVWFRNQTTVEIWVYNFGKVDLTVSSVYVNDYPVAFSVAGLPDGTVVVGEHGKIVLESSFGVGSSYRFKIVTGRGTAFEGVFTW